MRIAYLIPETSYAFFRDIVPHLAEYGHELTINPANLKSCDIAWAAMLPQTNEWANRRLDGMPTIVWNWDLFSFVDYDSLGWQTMFEAMPDALDIWSASYDTARLLKAKHGHDSYVIGSWVNGLDFGPQSYSGDFVFYAAPETAFHKRLNWVELACRRLKVPFRHTYQGPAGLTRKQYCDVMNSCRCYVMAAFEESNGTIPTLEAAMCRKPVLLSDLPACHEEFGDTATYFRPWDFEHLLETLNDVYHGEHPSVEAARERVQRLFGIENVARRIAGRLKELETRL